MIHQKINFIIVSKLILAAVILFSIPSYGQEGCKDPAANNYNPSATINDGSCTYNPTSYTPPIKTDPINSILVEGSGLQWADDFLWSFNDGGGAAAIYRIDTITSKLLQTVNLEGASNIDWEDITFDGTYFYMGDFGNNADGARTDLKIYKFPISAVPDYKSNPVATIPSSQIEIINFTYSDQPQPPVSSSTNNTKFDCEAMIVDNGKIHLFTKNWINTNTTHYVINSLDAGSYIAAPVETLNTGYLVTAADKAPAQNVITLLGYQVTGFGNHFFTVLSDYNGEKYFNGNKRKINLPDATVMGQAEGLTFRNSTYGYISNERFERSIGPLTITVNQKLRSFNISNFIPIYVLPVMLKNFNVTNSNGSNKIVWKFGLPVRDLEIQYSRDGIHFNSLKTYSNSVGGYYYNNKSSDGTSYYRLAWKKDDGAVQYSHVVTIKNEHKSSISNLLLRSNGELTFRLNDAMENKYSFRLFAADGKSISEIKQCSCPSGLNKIYFYHTLIANSFVLLSIYNGRQITTTKLHVEN